MTSAVVAVVRVVLNPCPVGVGRPVCRPPSVPPCPPLMPVLPVLQLATWLDSGLCQMTSGSPRHTTAHAACPRGGERSDTGNVRVRKVVVRGLHDGVRKVVRGLHDGVHQQHFPLIQNLSCGRLRNPCMLHVSSIGCANWRGRKLNDYEYLVIPGRCTARCPCAQQGQEYKYTCSSLASAALPAQQAPSSGGQYTRARSRYPKNPSNMRQNAFYNRERPRFQCCKALT